MIWCAVLAAPVLVLTSRSLARGQALLLGALVLAPWLAIIGVSVGVDLFGQPVAEPLRSASAHRVAAWIEVAAILAGALLAGRLVRASARREGRR